MKKIKLFMRGIMYLLLLMVALAVLEFVPVKYAKKYDSQEHNEKNNYYVCYQDDKQKFPDKRWVTVSNDIFYLQFTGDYPSKFLIESVLDNRFLIRGELKKNQSVTQEQISNLLSDSWDILYPIERNSIRGNYASKDYLTIYDFDWGKVIIGWVYK